MTESPVTGEVLDREPVLRAGKIAGLLSAFVVAVLGLVAIVAAGRYSDLDALGVAVSAVLTAGAALAAGLAPIWQAMKARAKVTPLVDPRDDDGTPLVADLGDGSTTPPYVAPDPRLVDTRTPGEAAHAAPDEPPPAG